MWRCGDTFGVSRMAAISSGVTWFTSIDESRSRSSPSIAPAVRMRPASVTPARGRGSSRVDAREDDLAVSLGDARRISLRTAVGGAAPRAAADERDHAERARERAAVLDLHERAHAVEPWSACTQPIAPTSPATASATSSLRRATTRTLAGRPAKALLVRLAAQPVT